MKYEIKILGSRKYDEQLNLAISSIETKIVIITKECKQFKSLNQTYESNLLKLMKVFKTKNLQTHGSI